MNSQHLLYIMTLALAHYRRQISLILLLLGFNFAFSQDLEVTNAPPITPENLITNVFLGAGVEVLGVDYEGSDLAVGFFKNGEEEIGIDRGIVMTTGRAVTQNLDPGVDAIGNGFASFDNLSGASDVDLNAIAGGTPIFNVSKYTIRFIPIADTLRFTYAFASEEYPEFVCSEFNDIFGFFISGPGIAGPYENGGDNIALIPGTDLPVRINNVNSGVPGIAGNPINCQPPTGSLAFSEFFNDNEASSLQPVYDGFTDVFTAQAIVVPCEEYTIKLVIADVTDQGWDSGVFLEAKSFGTGSLVVETATTSLDGAIAEGCQPGALTFSLPSRTESDFTIDYTILGTAINGVDYETIPTNLFIPAGDSIVSVPIIAIEDNIAEGYESILIDVQRDPCNRDTFEIGIRDNRLIQPDLGLDQTICPGDPIQLDGTLAVPLPAPPNFTNNTPTLISPANTAVFSDIEVSNVIPPILTPEVIKSICIDSLSHRWIDDLDIFLISPGGQFLELTTDNGGNGGNNLAEDFYLNTCFTIDADTAINFPGPFGDPDLVPFTGDWQPEGVWSDLWDGENPTNGTWRLQLFDDTNGLEGTLFSWSICFNPVYAIGYSWDPAEGLSCADCPNPIASPTTTTTYTMTATDSYGCTVSDEITFNVLPTVDAPMVNCDVVTENSITVTWQAVTDAISYEVNIDSSGWIASNGILEHLIDGLGFSQTVEIAVRAIGDCPGPVTLISCTTADCTPPTVQATPTDATCQGQNNGAVELLAVGGTGPYTFELEGQQNTTGIFIDLAVNDYQATITDATGCPALVNFSIGEANPLILTPTILNDISCIGAEDGEATVDVTGGTGQYSFNWSNGSTDPIATNLVEGINTVIVTDANNCTGTLEITISEPDSLQVNITTTPVTCNGANDGQILAGVGGGTAPYTYSWNGTPGGALLSNLGGGIYTLAVTDANGCQLTETVTLAESPPFLLQVDQTNLVCFNATNGSANVSPSGGAGGPFTYLWSNGATTPEITDIVAGDYTVLVTDADGCTASALVTITAPDSIQATVQLTAPSCSYSNNGQAAIGVVGGTGNLSYNWSDIGDGPAFRSDLTGGTYEVTITDNSGCAIVESFDLIAPDAIQAEITTGPVSCFGETDGTASVEILNGQGNYTFEWANGITNTTAVNNLPAGPLGLLITDSNNCILDTVADIASAPNLLFDIRVTEPSCFEETNGTASLAFFPDTVVGYSNFTLLVGGEQAEVGEVVCLPVLAANFTEILGMQFSIRYDPAFFSFQSISNLNLNGLSENLFGTPTNGLEEGYITLSWTGPAIAGETLPDGTVLFEICLEALQEGPTSPFIWDYPTPVEVSSLMGGVLAVDNISGTTLIGDFSSLQITWDGTQNGPQAIDLATGLHTLSIQGPNDCSVNQAFELDEPDILAATMDEDLVECNGTATGGATISVNGGTMPYTYLWSNGISGGTNSITDLVAGVYYVTVTDANNCSLEDSVLITEPPVLQLDINETNLSCNESADGIISAIATGGQGIVEYNWTEPNLPDVSVIENLSAGTYELEVTDENGCSISEVITLTEPEALQVAGTLTPPTCANDRDGSIETQAIGGVGSYQYSWSTGDTTAVVNDLLAGTYDLTLTDANNCVLIQTFEVAAIEAITIEFTTQDIDCNGASTGSIIAQVDGGTGPYDYQWSTGAIIPSLASLQAGNYSLTVTDSKGCEKTRDTSLMEPAAPLLVESYTEDPTCFGDVDGLIQLIGTGGTPPYEYSMVGEEFQSGASFIGLGGGTYNFQVRDALGCTYLLGGVVLREPEELQLELGETIFINFGSRALIEPQVTNGIGEIRYEWEPVDTSSISCTNCPTPFLSPDNQTTYYLLIEDENGCRARDWVTVGVRKFRTAFVPTGFSPNGDGNNDLLLVHGQEGTKVESFRVYDRWGELVYEATDFEVNDPTTGWNGNFRSKAMMAGVYVWTLEVEYVDGTKEGLKGNTTLFK